MVKCVTILSNERLTNYFSCEDLEEKEGKGKEKEEYVEKNKVRGERK
jgi:hypothetical protein